MNEIVNAVYPELINLVIIFITAMMGIATRKVTQFLNEKGIIEKMHKNRELVNTVVTAVEQAYSNLNGEEKLNLAKLEAVKLMSEKGIKISEKEVELLIESVVKEMKDEFKKGIGK